MMGMVKSGLKVLTTLSTEWGTSGCWEWCGFLFYVDGTLMYHQWFYWNPWIAICSRVEIVPDFSGSSLQLLLPEQVKKLKELSCCHSLPYFKLFWKELPLISPPPYPNIRQRWHHLEYTKVKSRTKEPAVHRRTNSSYISSFPAATAPQKFHWALKSFSICSMWLHICFA